MELALARIWSQVLGVDEIGRDDDFFALGGHSLLATQVGVRVRAELAIPLNVGAMLRFRSLRALAGHLPTESSALGDSLEDDDELESLLQELSALPESDVRELMHGLGTEDRT
jgi:hypothetical protein